MLPGLNYLCYFVPDCVRHYIKFHCTVSYYLTGHYITLCHNVMYCNMSSTIYQALCIVYDAIYHNVLCSGNHLSHGSSLQYIYCIMVQLTSLQYDIVSYLWRRCEATLPNSPKERATNCACTRPAPNHSKKAEREGERERGRNTYVCTYVYVYAYMHMYMHIFT